MLSVRKKKGEKEVPQWKLDMLGKAAPAPAPAPTPAPAASSSAGVAREAATAQAAPDSLLAFAGEASGQKRPRGEDEPAAQGGAHRSYDEDAERAVRHRPPPDDDDDDDDDVDLSAYELGEEEKPREEVTHHASAQRFANKENAAALYTPGAKSNADMVAEVRRRRKREGLERASLFFFPSSRL